MEDTLVWQSLEPIFRWAYNTSLGTAIRDSTWAFAYIEVFHLFGLTIVLGAAIVVALRVAGLILLKQPVANVWREIRPVLTIGFILVTVSGALMFAAESFKVFQSYPFQMKMLFFFSGLIFHFVFFRRLLTSKSGNFNPLIGKISAVLLLVIWFGVGVFGRAIGFF